ncbi:MAG: hypothetical protein GF355_09680 [Candidatus Eisenbacteria bacterium]|nr:hypothetical protein [Candidatus Eisenbacteria bacterium]
MDWKKASWLVVLAELVVPLSVIDAEPWEQVAELPWARYTLDLTTTAGGVYMILADSSEATMGLYKYDRLVPGRPLEFVGKPGEPLYSVHVAGSMDEHIWLGTEDTGALWHSSDGGETWVEQEGISDKRTWALDGSEAGDRVYTAPGGGLCFQTSYDLGETWYTWGDCTDISLLNMCIETDFFDPDRAYALSEDMFFFGCGYVLETTNGGQDWEGVSAPCNPVVHPGIYPSPFQSGDVTVAIESGPATLYTRVGGEWSILYPPSLGNVFGVVQPIWDGGSRWIAGGTLSHTLHIWRQAGSSWVLRMGGLQLPDVDWNRKHDARMWACPINGDIFLATPGMKLWMYRAPASTAPELSLSGSPWMQAYPNPSGGQTTMRLRNVPQGGYRLIVHDVLGRRIRLLHRGPLEGNSTWRWDGRDEAGRRVPTGVYFIRLAAGAEGTRLAHRVLVLEE